MCSLFGSTWDDGIDVKACTEMGPWPDAAPWISGMVNLLVWLSGLVDTRARVRGYESQDVTQAAERELNQDILWFRLVRVLWHSFRHFSQRLMLGAGMNNMLPISQRPLKVYLLAWLNQVVAYTS